MPKYTEQKLLAKMKDVTRDLDDSAYDISEAMDDAIGSYEMLSEREPRVSDESALAFLELDMKYLADATKRLNKMVPEFDKHLAKLIALRLQLAEAADLPVDLTGGKAWARNEEYTL